MGFGLSARTGPARELLVAGGAPLKGNSYHSFGYTPSSVPQLVKVVGLAAVGYPQRISPKRRHEPAPGPKDG